MPDPVVVVRSRVVQARKLVRSLRTRRGRQALRHGVAATGTHQSLLRTLAPATVIDVGANRGQFALDVATALPDATVVSFEPIPAAADTYRQVFAGEPRFELIQSAVGATSGPLELHLSAHDDSSSLLPIGDAQVQAFPGTGQVGTITVPVVTLDEALHDRLLPRPVLLKLDVQGYELDALKGATATLGSIEWVYLEASFEELYVGQPHAAEIVAWLAGHGFGLAGIGDLTRVAGTVVQADLLFRRRPADGADTAA